MENPESSSPSPPVSPRVMFSYDNHKNVPWNISQYTVPALHHDNKQVLRDRMYAAQKRGVKVNDFYVTKRGFYMDYELKQAKGVPSSVVHIDQKPWDHTKTVLEGGDLKIMRETKKFTYLDRIQKEQQVRPVPCITTYKMEKSIDEQVETAHKISARQISHGEKRFFHEDTSFLSDKMPGPGEYSPHSEVEHIRKTRGDWKVWTKKHESVAKMLQKRESKVPAPGTYSPLYRSYSSFEVTEKKQKREKQIKNGFGSDARFPYVRPNKKVIREKSPAPSRYQTGIDWKGKSVSPKKKQWIKMVWTGSPPKVYN